MTFEPYTAAILAIIFCSTLARSTFGFGNALVAMPLLALVVGDALGRNFASAYVALNSAIIAAVITWQDWRHVDLRSATRLVISSCFGIPVGLYLLAHLDMRIVKSVLAILIIAFSAYALLRPKLIVLSSERPIYLFGFLAGVLGGAYNTHGPPLVIYGSLRRWPPDRFRATLQGYTLPAGLMIVVGHGLAGSLQPVVLREFLYSLPLVLAALVLGRRINQRFDTRTFIRYVHILLILIGTMLLVTSLQSGGLLQRR